MAFIYKIENKINSKIYIGKTIRQPQARWNEHKSESNTVGHGYNYPLHNAIRKYGIENFIFEVIEQCEDEKAFERETYYIKLYDSCNKDKGYNIVIEGSGRTLYSSEQLLKLWNEGLTLEEIAKKIGAYSHCSISDRIKALGITDEDIRKRQGQKTRERCSKPVLQYTLSGNFIKRWDSATQCKDEGYQQTAISSVCRQEQKSAYGFLWKYEEDTRDIQEWVYNNKNKKDAGKPKKRIKQISLNGEVIKIYESAADAARELGYKSKSNICGAARKGCKSHGFYWEYC